jgi:transposase
MPAAEPASDKVAALRRHHALNPRPGAVRDPAFVATNPFFDPRDLVQVKYEMLRRVREDRQSVSETAADFGFSRPSFYQAQSGFTQAGLPGLVPQRPGPRRAHKLTVAAVDLLATARAQDPALTSDQLTQILAEELGIQVHRRSVERALARRKKGLQPR